MSSYVPVITIDGPSASGKGTISERIAKKLGWIVLDSGLIYRMVALSAIQQAVHMNDILKIVNIAKKLDIKLYKQYKNYKGIDHDKIRLESVGEYASHIARYSDVRKALLGYQRSYLVLPGLIADGRDMGTTVFPNAALKVFLTADIISRVKRRSKQLIEKNTPVSMQELSYIMQKRDLFDHQRSNSPLIAAPDAYVLDSSSLTIEQTVQTILNLLKYTGSVNKE